ncbi:alpha/beta fold hydrolase [Streptomyces sp. S465]|uniref:alpha/beta fold hydrolase n=1 Tax=Streptomyces sp. S465 TaxID=2979468 RepID=UPI0022A8D15D|nr:alpha/beta hydrolase [Streptomyces sp. S465]WAP54751.1 alpha/beta hydrolase [Streptomyces sp. S465]
MTGPVHGWAGAADGPVTVVLHGGGPGCHATSDFGAVMAMRPERRWLWADLPGYGGSVTGPSAVRRSPTAAAHALAALLDRVGPGRVDVLTQSYGGLVALRLAADRPERIGRIVLIGSRPTPAPGGAGPLRADPGLGARVRAEYYGGDGPSPAKMRALLAALEWYDTARIPESTVLARYRASVTDGALATAAMPAPAEDLGHALGAVKAPTLVLWGRHDPFAGPDYAAALADALPRGDLAVVGRTAHHPQAERPAAVAALADAFLTHRS